MGGDKIPFGVVGGSHSRLHRRLNKKPHVKHKPYNSTRDAPKIIIKSKNREKTKTSSSGTTISFFVNNKEINISTDSLDPELSLAEYLRYTLKLTGTKIGCGEGGCGACTVLIERPDPKDGSKTIQTLANSCLRPVASLDGAHVTTVEGIGSKSEGFHPIQVAMAENDGTQCGYCTPGMVMAIYGLLSKNKTPSQEDVEQFCQGNICRCTGYANIYKAARAAAANASTTMKKRSNGTEKKLHERLVRKSVVSTKNSDTTYINATTLDDVFEVLESHGPAESSSSLRLVCGNTSKGVVKYYAPTKSDRPQIYCDISRIPDLLNISMDSSSITFGASVTLSNVISSLENLISKGGMYTARGMGPYSQKNITHIADSYRKKITRKKSTLEYKLDYDENSDTNARTQVRHLKLVAHPQVRDVSSWTGNLMLAKAHPNFPSDVVIVLIAANASLTLMDSKGVKVSTDVMTFLKTPLEKTQIVYSVCIPFAKENEFTDTFKIMLRHTNSHALVNAGFRASIDTTTTSTTPMLTSLDIVVGNIKQVPFDCPNTSKLVKEGVPLSLETCKMLCDSIKSECVVTPCPVEDPDFIVEDPEYRQNLTSSLLYKFFLSLMIDCKQSVDSSLVSAATHYVREVSKSSETFDESAEVLQAIHKIEGKLQSSGEVEYCSDTLLPSGTLFAVPLLATRSGVAIDSVDISEAMTCPGIVKFVSAEDLSSINASNKIAAYTVFADSSSPVKHVGQIIGLLCGQDGFDSTKRAVDKISIVYKTSKTYVEEKEEEDVEAYTTGCKPAPSKEPDFSVFLPRDDDDEETAVITSSTKEFSSTISTTGQKHFYMETQSTLVVPNKSADSIVVTCATQCLTSIHNELSKTLDLKASNITVQAVSVGGAYGGKAYLPAPIAAATSVAALVTKRPVLCQLSRNDDMSSLGGRPACSADFTVKVNDSTGEITDMKVHTTVDAGFDKSGGVTLIFKYTNHNAYSLGLFDSHLSSENKITNTAVNTIMRAPGDFQGALFTEACVECAARISGLDTIKVQEANLDKNVLPCWNEVKTSSNVEQKQKDVDAFNASNRWRKRGLYMCGVKYLAYTVIYTEKVMLSCHSDGSVSVNSSGIEMGQGINTKVVQAVSYGLGKMFDSPLSFDSISVARTKSTSSFEGVSPTWGSGTSESCVEACLKACEDMVSKLEPYKSKGTNFQQVVAAASAAGVDLNSTGTHHLYNGGTYEVYGACCSVVELDVLTGECQILSTDIVYDCGSSLNVYIDVGQVQGCFVQGAGFCLLENVARGKDNRVLANGTWEYKVPQGLDIPIDFNVSLLKGSKNNAIHNVLGSKESGEPAYLLGICPFFALKQAVYAARQDVGNKDYFRMDCPASPSQVQKACLVSLF